MPPYDEDCVGGSHPGPLTAHLMAGFAPLEVQIEVNAITAAVFSEEMTLRSFPVDQQKVTFAFSTGIGVRKSLRITPASLDAGSFAIKNYKLGNVFDVVHLDKVFVGEIDADGDKKGIRFEMMLERCPGSYVTNVAIPAAIITYLCFISYAPLADGSLMDTGDRFQIVLTLLLTAVTFKNQVAALTPQISYFTTLDKYVFFCFIITCSVAIENALFPLFVDIFPKRESWQENSLLGFSCGFFTLVNAVWAIYLVVFIKIRRQASATHVKVHDTIKVLSTSIPPEDREAFCTSTWSDLIFSSQDQLHRVRISLRSATTCRQRDTADRTNWTAGVA